MGTKTVDWDTEVEVDRFTEDGDVSFNIVASGCDRSTGQFEFDYTVLSNGSNSTSRKRLGWRDKGESFSIEDRVNVGRGKLVSVEIVRSGTTASCEIEEDDQ